MTLEDCYLKSANSVGITYCVTDPRVPEEDSVKEQNIFVYFPLGTPERSERMEKFLKENNFLFLMSNDVPFTD